MLMVQGFNNNSLNLEYFQKVAGSVNTAPFASQCADPDVTLFIRVSIS